MTSMMGAGETTLSGDWVSYIVPCYNSVQHLRDTVLSCRNQDYRPIELLLVDDGSTDETSELAARLALELNTEGFVIRPMRQHNGGFLAARNTGLRAARGRWIGFLDHDDLLPPRRTGQLVAALTRLGASLAYGKSRNFLTGAEPLASLVVDDEVVDIVLEPAVKFVPDVFQFLAARELIDQVGEFFAVSRREEDFSFILRLRYHARRALRLSQEVYWKRSVPGSISSGIPSVARVQDRVKCMIELLRVLEALNLLGETRSAAFLRQFRSALSWSLRMPDPGLAHSLLTLHRTKVQGQRYLQLLFPVVRFRWAYWVLQRFLGWAQVR